MRLVALPVALVFGVGAWTGPAHAGICKADGQACSTNQSCCGRACVNSNPPGKRPKGVCCTPTTCAGAGADCGTIPNGSCGGTLECGTCGVGEICGAESSNVCGTTTTTTSTTSTTSTTLEVRCEPADNTGSDSETGCPCVGTFDCCGICSATNECTGANRSPSAGDPGAALICLDLECTAVDNAGSDSQNGCPCIGTFDCCGICSATHLCTGANRPPAGGDPGAAPTCP